MGILALKGLVHWAKKEGESNRCRKAWYYLVVSEEDKMIRQAL